MYDGMCEEMKAKEVELESCKLWLDEFENAHTENLLEAEKVDFTLTDEQATKISEQISKKIDDRISKELKLFGKKMDRKFAEMDTQLKGLQDNGSNYLIPKTILTSKASLL